MPDSGDVDALIVCPWSAENYSAVNEYSPLVLAVLAVPFRVILGYTASAQYDFSALRVLHHFFAWVAECDSCDISGITFRADYFCFLRHYRHEVLSVLS